MTKAQYVLHDRGIVPLCFASSLVGGSGGEGLVHFTAQFAVFREGHYGHVRRDFQRNQPANHFTGLGGLSSKIQGKVWEPREAGFIFDQLGPTLRCIEHVFSELAGKTGQLLGDFPEARFLIRFQCYAGKFKVPQRVAYDLFLAAVQGCVFVAVGDLLVGPVKGMVLAEFGRILA